MPGAITSQTNQPGFAPNDAANLSGTSGTHPHWRATLAEFMASMWANGRRQEVLDIISPSWYSAQFGEPDPSDADGLWSTRTLLAFSRWAEKYQPGMSPYIDQVLPYVPPGPNDFIETPEQTAARVLDAETLRQFEEEKRQFDTTTAEGKRQFDLTFNAGELQRRREEALDRFSTESGNWQNAENLKATIFGTQSNTYNNQEGNRVTTLGKAGDLSMALQQAMDSRTKSALDAKANPGDYLRAEYETRAIAPPQGSTSPAYQDVDSLAEVIKRLINYVPGEAPAAPVAGAAPTFQTPEAATTQPAAPAHPLGRDIFTDNREPTRPRHPAMLSGFAYGIQGTRDHQFISGDPQVGMQANPELVTVNNPGPNTSVDVTPVAKVAKARLKGKKMFAFGTGNDLQLTSYEDTAYQNQPRAKYLAGGSAKDYNKLATGFAGGAFGMNVPEAGRLNYTKAQNIMSDPIALAMATADYRAANRDLFSTVAKAKARAPLGQSVNTSMVRY